MGEPSDPGSAHPRGAASPSAAATPPPEPVAATGPRPGAGPDGRPAAGGTAKPARRKGMAPGKVVAMAIAANLLIAGSVAAAVAPVETSEAALRFYDSWPAWLRGLLGDRTGSDGETERGWLGSWLSGFHANAVRGDPKAQLGMPLGLESETQAPGVWTTASEVDVRWVNHGATLTYRLAATATPEAPPLASAFDVETTATEATLPLAPGETWVHLQASHRGQSGDVATLGPFLSDPQPPSAPGAPAVQGGTPGPHHTLVDAYHFTLQWAPSQATSGIASYHLERRVGTDWVAVATIDGANTTHMERNRPNGDYAYRVVATSVAGLASEAGPPLTVRVDAQGSLEPPGFGAWHFGVNAVYDSVIHVWDISDPGAYATVDAIHGGQGGLSATEVAQYTSPGWGITIGNQTIRSHVAQQLGATDMGDRLAGGERNALQIGLTLFEWMFNEVDYDFDKLTTGTDLDLMQANEVLDAGGGICGDLTALFVTLMRIAGVPARPVHGYLINDGGATDQDFDRTIGGFHMWPEIYVGGAAQNGPGGGWIPIDVSGVTGDFDVDKLHFYFGVSNPNYLQLGVQRDLSEPGWNVWANLGYSYTGEQPVIEWTADALIQEPEAETGVIWFTPGSPQRVYCADGDDECRGTHTRGFTIKGRSVRTMDYGADLSWSGNVVEARLSLRFPDEVGPTQVVMWTPYQRGPDCVPHDSHAAQEATGFLRWTIGANERPCS